MEHRWGRRTNLNLEAQVRGLAQRDGTTAQIANLSVSGALIRTALDIEVFTGIEVRLNHQWLLAWVTRRGSGLIGVEWMQMAPDAVLRELEVAALRPGVRGQMSAVI